MVEHKNALDTSYYLGIGMHPAPRALQSSSPSILFCFQLLLRRRKTSTLSIRSFCPDG